MEGKYSMMISNSCCCVRTQKFEHDDRGKERKNKLKQKLSKGFKLSTKEKREKSHLLIFPLTSSLSCPTFRLLCVSINLTIKFTFLYPQKKKITWIWGKKVLWSLNVTPLYENTWSISFSFPHHYRLFYGFQHLASKPTYQVILFLLF